MCGITGFTADRAIAVDPWLGDSLRCVRHRGPDRSSIWIVGDARRSALEATDGDRQAVTGALGFARLSIIDLSEASDQPFIERGRATLVFNGEIYNYVELREELIGRGWRFASAGDAEVLLKAYLEWGLDALPRLNGMFALAIADEERGTLLLARDRFGEKPLFWTRWSGGIAFASEVKQLARYPGVDLDLDERPAASFLATGRPYVGFSSWFRGIEQVEPGTWVEASEGTLRVGRYHDLRAEVAAIVPERSAEDWAERFSAAWRRSVEVRLRSDVPVGTSLSSGVDSSAVLVEAAELGHERYHAFTLRYDAARDEGSEAEALAAAVGATWHPVWVTPEDFAEAWDRLVWHHETPVATASAYGQSRVFEAAHDAGVRVVLDGQGSDEILGGYHKFYASHTLDRVRRRGPLAIGDLVAFGRHVGLSLLARRGLALFAARRQPASGPLVPHDGPTGPGLLPDLLQMRLADIETWSLPTLLAYADRNAMAHSVETRLPFLDPGLVALALAMPGAVLFRSGWTKWPLRHHLAQRGAAAAAWRRGKRWFDLPSDDWVRTCLRPKVSELVARPHDHWERLTPIDRVRRRAAELSVQATPAASSELMALVALDRFFRVWFGERGGDPGPAYVPAAPSKTAASR